MPRHVFKDVPDGDNITYDVVDEENGYRQCTFAYPFEVHQDLFNRIPTLKCKDGDIILESYPKTGTYAIHTIITHRLFTVFRKGHRLEIKNLKREKCLLFALFIGNGPYGTP
jgi:hypothetical protein